MEYLAIRVNRNTFDVFEGRQWGQDHEMGLNSSWSRLKAGRNGVYVCKGRSLPHSLTKQLAACVDPREERQLLTLN